MNNPWMSLWLGSANAMKSAAFGPAASMGRKQLEVFSSKAAEDLMTMWFTPWVQPRQAQRRKAR